MQEIKISEGHKATILGGTIRIEPIEKAQGKITKEMYDEIQFKGGK